MKRFHVVEVVEGRTRIEDTLAPKDKYGKHPTVDYYFDDPPFEVGDWVQLKLALLERPVKETG